MTLFSIGCSKGTNGTDILFYVPIGAETYAPITPDNIESQGRSFDVDHRLFVELCLMASGSPSGKVDCRVIRVKIVSSDGVILIDNDGGFMFSNGAMHQLNPSQMRRVRRLLEGLRVGR